MKIVKYWNHSCEKRAKRRVGKDLQDEVDVERVKNEGAVVHGEKKKVDGAQPGARCKKGASGEVCSRDGENGDEAECTSRDCSSATNRNRTGTPGMPLRG
jgi:hypothetical protein